MPQQPIFNAPRSVLIAIFLFCAVHFYVEFVPLNEKIEIYRLFAFYISRFEMQGETLALSLPFKLLSFVSHSFLHSDGLHLGMNMVWFLIFGTPLARRWSLVNVIIFYSLCAIVGAMVFYIFGRTGPMIGASGAIAGLMAGSFRFMFAQHRDGTALNLKDMTQQPFIQNFFIFWLFSNVFLAMMMDNVAWEAHLGGFLAGLLLFPFFERVK